MIKKLAATISILGFFISLYLFYEKMVGGTLICGISSCDTVNSSVYSEIYNIPVSFFGILYYIGTMLLILFKKYKYFFALSVVGVLFSAYLTYLEAFVIESWCQWCILSAWLVICQFAIGIRFYKGLSKH